MNYLVVILILFSKRKKCLNLTQELKYPSSDKENYSDDIDSDQSLPDLTNLKAFDFERTCGLS